MNPRLVVMLSAVAFLCELAAEANESVRWTTVGIMFGAFLCRWGD